MTVTTIPVVDAVDLSEDMIADALGERFTYITGRCVPYGEPTDLLLFTEEFARGAFTESLVINPNVPLLWSHDRGTLPVGVAVAWDDRPDGLWARFKISGNGLAQTIAGEVRDGFIGGLSVGFAPDRTKDRWTYVANYNPELGKVDHVVRTKARLLEVSLTPTPAYAGALVTDVESEPLTLAARSLLAAARFNHDAHRRLRDHDRSRREHERAQREIADWQRYLKSIRRVQ